MLPVIIVMGVSGVGKTTLATALAEQLGAHFLEGDRFHPDANVRKMAAGIALSDEDRWPWLDRLGAAISASRVDSAVVAACSALKRSYRDRLRLAIGGPLLFVCPQADRAVLAQRMQARKDHYMPVSLLDDQLRTLELPQPDEKALLLAASSGVDRAVAEVRSWLLSVAFPGSFLEGRNHVLV